MNTIHDMTARFSLALITLLTSVCTHASEAVSIGPAPDFVNTETRPVEYAIPYDQVSDGVYYLLVDRQVDATSSPSRNYYRYVARALDVSGAESLTQVLADFDPEYERITWHWINVIRDGQTVMKLYPEQLQLIQREQNLERNLIDGHLSSFMILTDLRPGDELDYAFTIEGDNPATAGQISKRIQTQWGQPLGKLHTTIRVPESRQIRTANQAQSYFEDNDGKPIVTIPQMSSRQLNGVIEYRVEAEDIPAFIYDNQMPADYPMGSVWQLSSYQDWGAVRKWGQGLFDPLIEPDQAVYAQMYSLTSKDDPIEKKITELIRWVQEDIRYTGIEIGSGSYQPSSPDVVMDRRFGDCKDKSVLLVSLLDSIGVESSVALVSANNSDFLKHALPTHTAFDHAIVRVRHLGEDYWIDPTLNNQGGTFPAIQNVDYGQALVLAPGETELIAMEKEPPYYATRIVRHHYSIDDISSNRASLTVQTDMYGKTADNYRLLLNSDSHSQLQQRFIEYYQRIFKSVELEKPFTVDDDFDSNHLVISERYRISDIWTADDDKQLSLQLAALEMIDAIDSVEEQDRQYPYTLSHPINMEQNITVRLPESWPSMSESKTLEDPAFNFSANVRLTGNNLTMRYTYKTLQESVAAEDFNTYANKLNQSFEFLEYSLTTPDPGVGIMETIADVVLNTGPNRELLIVMIVSFIFSIMLALRIHRWDPEPRDLFVKDKYTGIRGWAIVLLLMIILHCGISLLDSYAWTILFTGSEWQALLSRTSSVTGLDGQVLILIETAASCLFAVMLLLSLWLLIRKRSSFPRVYAITMLSGLGWVWLMQWMYSGIDELASLLTLKDKLRITSSTLIWTTYALVSVRIASTCRRRFREKDENRTPETDHTASVPLGDSIT